MADDLANSREPLREILTGVVRYLVGHPRAKDTLEGIRRWWPAAGTPEWPPAELEEVLEELAAREWVLIRDTAQGRLWGANPSRLAEMERYLVEHTKE